MTERDGVVCLCVRERGRSEREGDIGKILG